MATILEAVAANGGIQRFPMSAAGQTAVSVEPGYRYRLVDDAGGRVTSSAQVKRVGGDLVVEGLHQDGSVVLEGFFTRCTATNSCSLSLENLGGTAADAITPTTAPIGALSGGGFLMYASGGAAPAIPSPPESGFDFKPVLGVAGGLAIIGGAGGGGGGGGGGSSDSTPPAAPVITSPAFTPTAKPVFTGTAEPGATVTITVAGAVTYSTPVGTNGTWRIDTGTATPSAGALPPIAEGATVTLVARATDAAGNGSALTNATVTLDSMAPGAPDITSALRTNDATPTIRGTAEPGARVEVALDLDRNGTVDVTYAALADSAGGWVVEVGTTPASGALPGGKLADVSTTNLTVTAFDRAGNPSPTIGETLEVDVRIPGPPVIETVAVDNAINAIEAGASVTIRGTLPAEHPDRPVTVTWGTASLVATVSGLAWEATFPAGQIPGDGTATVIASFTSALGTLSVEGRQDILIDRVAPAVPTITDDAPTTAAGPITFVFTFAEPVRGFTAGDVAVTGGSKGAFTGVDGDTVYTLVVSPAAGTEGNVTVAVPASSYTDIVGNPNAAGTAAHTQPFDLKPPTVAISDNVAGTATGDVTYTFTFSEAVSGFTSDDVAVSGGTKGAFAEISATVYTLVVTPDAGAQGSIGVSVAGGSAVDVVGNPNSAATAPAQPFDRLLPTLNITDSGGATASGPVTFTFTFSEPVTGFTAEDVAVTGIPGGTAGPLTGSGALYHMVVTPPTDAIGTIGVSVAPGVVTDTAGNPSGGDTANRPYDTNVPPTLSISDNASAATATGPVTFTFTFSENVTGFTSSDADIVVSGGTKGAFSGSGLSYQLVVNPTEDRTGVISVSVPQGAAIDGGGNPNVAASTTQPFDVRVPPSVVSIGDDVSGPPTNDPVTFTFTFSENVTFLQNIQVSGGTAAGVTGGGNVYQMVVTPAENASGDIVVTVPENAVQDAAGNLNVVPSSASQAFDTDPPDPPGVEIRDIDGPIGSGNFTTDTAPTLELTFPGLLEAATIEVRRDGTLIYSAVAAGSPTSFDDDIPLPAVPGTYAYTYTASLIDTAGNAASSDPYVIQFNVIV